MEYKEVGIAGPAVESVRLPGQPREEWVRGECPMCGQPLVANCYYVGQRGYIVTHDCWASLSEPPLCTFRKII